MVFRILKDIIEAVGTGLLDTLFVLIDGAGAFALALWDITTWLVGNFRRWWPILFPASAGFVESDLRQIESQIQTVTPAIHSIQKNLVLLNSAMEKENIPAELRAHMENIHKSILSMRCVRCEVQTQPHSPQTEGE